jgi:hypothetical protein
MINPAEDITNIWLQECCGHFVMSNIIVKKKTRRIKNKNVGGGRGKEIDFISTDGRGHYFWTEVSVSANPRLPRSITKSMPKIVSDYVNKFATEKEKWIHNQLNIKTIKKQFVYSHKIFSKNTREEAKFCNKLRKKGIDAKSFSNILRDVYEKLDHMGFDAPRQYLYILKKFGYKYQS